MRFPAISAWLVPMLVALASFPPGAAADTSKPLHTDPHHVAIAGYDPVAYFTLGRATKGDPAHAAQWQDSEWHIANESHRELFPREPERFAPQLGGLCTMALGKGALVQTHPENWVIVDGKLFLTFSEGALTRLCADTAGHVKRAETQWVQVASR